MSSVKEISKMSGIAAHTQICVDGVVSYLSGLVSERKGITLDVNSLKDENTTSLVEFFENQLSTQLNENERQQIIAFLQSRQGQLFAEIFSKGAIYKAFSSAYAGFKIDIQLMAQSSTVVKNSEVKNG